MFGISKSRLNHAKRETSERVVFLVLDLLVKLIGKKRTALFADHLWRVRNRATYLIVEAANLWIEAKTSYRSCYHCFEFVIDDSLPESHEQCEADEVQFLEELEDSRCHNGHFGCNGDDDCELNEECPGGCGETVSGCVCVELKSLREYNATPLEERCGPWTA